MAARSASCIERPVLARGGDVRGYAGLVGYRGRVSEIRNESPRRSNLSLVGGPINRIPSGTVGGLEKAQFGHDDGNRLHLYASIDNGFGLAICFQHRRYSPSRRCLTTGRTVKYDCHAAASRRRRRTGDAVRALRPVPRLHRVRPRAAVHAHREPAAPIGQNEGMTFRPAPPRLAIEPSQEVNLAPPVWPGSASEANGSAVDGSCDSAAERARKTGSRPFQRAPPWREPR